MSWLLSPLAYQFFRHGLLAAVLVGATCGAIGVYVVLRRMSYIGHALSHSVFAGAVLSYLARWDYYVGAGLAGLLGALLIDALSHRRRASADSVIGTVSTASLGLGIAMISRVHQFTKNLQAVLFGNILGVVGEDLLVLGIVAFLVLLLILFAYRPLLFATFDPGVAAVYGVRTKRVDILLTLAVALVIVASLQVLGETLVAAVLIIPAATARLMTERFGYTLIFAVAIGVFSGVVGMYLSYYTDIASGASITLTAAGLYGIAHGLHGLRELAWPRKAA